ncbi:hypothetical protein GJ496_005040 [Pomphorhynchus laevis]|nr:hypothetical protein GJ496_005040 [Pomphorhynchus laevis]
MSDGLFELEDILVKRHARKSKFETLVETAKLVVANPKHAVVRYPDNRESFVSLRDVAPGGAKLTTSSNAYNGLSNQSNDTTNEEHIQDILSDQKMNNNSIDEEDFSYVPEPGHDMNELSHSSLRP